MSDDAITRLARAMPAPMQQNMQAATRQMFLSPQEQSLYARHLTNLWGNGGVNNPDGSRSSLYDVDFTGPDNRQYNVPSVYNGQILSPDAAIQRAFQSGLSQFPSYPSVDAAEGRYQAMHNYMDQDTGNYMGVARVNGYPLYPTLDNGAPQNTQLLAALAQVRR